MQKAIQARLSDALGSRPNPVTMPPDEARHVEKMWILATEETAMLFLKALENNPQWPQFAFADYFFNFAASDKAIQIDREAVDRFLASEKKTGPKLKSLLLSEPGTVLNIALAKNLPLFRDCSLEFILELPKTELMKLKGTPQFEETLAEALNLVTPQLVRSKVNLASSSDLVQEAYNLWSLAEDKTSPQLQQPCEAFIDKHAALYKGAIVVMGKDFFTQDIQDAWPQFTAYLQSKG